MSEQVITFEKLNEISYGPKLKGKLEELGVGDAWKQGDKKVEIINKALSMLENLKNGQNPVFSETENETPNSPETEKLSPSVDNEVVTKPVSEKPVIGTEASEDEVLSEIETELKSEAAEEEKEFSEAPDEVDEGMPADPREVLEKNLARINNTLKKALPTHRDILVHKRNDIMEQLKWYEENE